MVSMRGLQPPSSLVLLFPSHTHTTHTYTHTPHTHTHTHTHTQHTRSHTPDHQNIAPLAGHSDDAKGPVSISQFMFLSSYLDIPEHEKRKHFNLSTFACFYFELPFPNAHPINNCPNIAHTERSHQRLQTVASRRRWLVSQAARGLRQGSFLARRR